jgi:hypothetical protein
MRTLRWWLVRVAAVMFFANLVFARYQLAHSDLPLEQLNLTVHLSPLSATAPSPQTPSPSPPYLSATPDAIDSQPRQNYTQSTITCS